MFKPIEEKTFKKRTYTPFIIAGIVAVVVLVVVIVIVMMNNKPIPPVYQTTTYQPDTSNFRNPERGWYEVVMSGEPLTEAQLFGYAAEGLSLVKVYYNLADYKDAAMAEAVIERLKGDLEVARTTGFKLIPLFYYTSEANADAPVDIVLQHIDQVGRTIELNNDIIPWLEPGFVGIEGTWSGSAYNYLDPNTLAMQEDGKAVIEKWRKYWAWDRMLALPFAATRVSLLGSEAIPLEQAYLKYSPDTVRTGFSNGMAFSSCQMGDFYAGGDAAALKTYVQEISAYTLQVGMPMAFCADEAGKDAVLAEMVANHWSAMGRNYPAAADVYAAWQQDGTAEALSVNLGYRYRLIDATLPEVLKPGAMMSVTLTMINDGYARPINGHGFEVVLKNKVTQVEYIREVYEIEEEDNGNRLFLPGPGEGEQTLNIYAALPKGMQVGEYEVYLYLPDPKNELYGRPEYAIRLANDGLWDPMTGYHNLGLTLTVDPSGPGTLRDENDLTIELYHSRSKKLSTPVPAP